MGFLDKFRKKKDEQAPPAEAPKKEDSTGQKRRIKKYTSEGKPVYE